MRILLSILSSVCILFFSVSGECRLSVHSDVFDYSRYFADGLSLYTGRIQFVFGEDRNEYQTISTEPQRGQERHIPIRIEIARPIVKPVKESNRTDDTRTVKEDHEVHLEKNFDLFFRFNRYHLTRDQFDRLEKEISDFRNEIMKQCTFSNKNENVYENMHAEIEGCACVIGPLSYNRKLSYKRAQEVGKILQKYGIRVNKIYGRGECMDSKDLKLNRKARVKLDFKKTCKKNNSVENSSTTFK